MAKRLEKKANTVEQGKAEIPDGEPSGTVDAEEEKLREEAIIQREAKVQKMLSKNKIYINAKEASDTQLANLIETYGCGNNLRIEKVGCCDVPKCPRALRPTRFRRCKYTEKK